MIVVVDPGLATTNIGDKVISKSIHAAFIEPMRATGADIETVPLHGHLSAVHRATLRRADDVVVTGTNLLSDHMRFSSAWEWPREDISLAEGKLTVLGAGWWQYQRAGIDWVSAAWLRALSSGRPWAVRDQYSAAKLGRARVRAVHLSCPTLWDVTEQEIPKSQSRVVATLTDYNQDPAADLRLHRYLADRFDDVSFWPQGPGDAEYIAGVLGIGAKVLQPTMGAFEDALKVPDTCYVGLRLHAGIFAMQFGVPSLVISVDNRALEISRSVGLGIASRFSVADFDRLLDGSRIRLDLPRAGISKWLGSWGISA